MQMVCICAMLTLELRQFQVSSTATAVILTIKLSPDMKSNVLEENSEITTK